MHGSKCTYIHTHLINNCFGSKNDSETLYHHKRTHIYIQISHQQFFAGLETVPKTP